MKLNRVTGKGHQFRLVLCGHKAVEAGAVCLVLMVGAGHLGDVTPVCSPCLPRCG